MQKVFQILGFLSILLFLFLLFNLIFPKVFSLDIQGINDWAGGIGGFLLGVLSFLVGSSKEASKEIGLKISKINIFNKNTGDSSGDGDNRNNTYNLPK